MSNITENSKLSKARYAALNAVVAVRKNEAFAKAVLNKILNEHMLSGEDRAFAAKLTLGVTQMLGTLDDAIYRCVDSPDDIKDNVMDCLRISAYEILYLEKEPHAAVDQGVELVKSVEMRARGLANLVLRRLVSIKDDFPFGDPDTDFEAFARIYAVPKWLCQLCFDSIGHKAGRYLISSCNGTPTCYIFVNSIKSSVEEMQSLLESVDAKPQVIERMCDIELNGCIRIDKPAALQMPELKEALQLGKYLIADSASQAIVTSVVRRLENPQNMLDICCGKGNKALMFQTLFNAKLGRQLQYSAIDNVESKVKILSQRASNFDVNIEWTYVCDASDENSLYDQIGIAKFDCVFVDAPCSGLGTLRRHPELKWRLTKNKIEQLAHTGLNILQNAAAHVKPGGILAYSTCTVTNLENNEVIEKFLKSQTGLQFDLLIFNIKGNDIPYFYTQTFSGLNDSHFLAILKRVDV